MKQNSSKRPFAFAILPFISIATGCTPMWSIKLDPITNSGVERITVTDARPANEKAFRTVDFLKLTYQSFLGDSNIVPDRVSLFKAKVNQLAPAHVASTSVVLEHFEVLRDTSGSACSGCGLAAISIPAAIIATSGNRPSDDYFRCTISASINGITTNSEAVGTYREGAFVKSSGAKSASAGLQQCMDSAISAWVEAALHPR
ncbi:hypothetical protein [Dokdonella immobilis]|uniref:hypothetical protein n=1 Tax=Dokdonella immobilis TaxID=578942 RepID=UPI001113580C|nr:hypothetical protein [Dokdonella immobilis]